MQHFGLKIHLDVGQPSSFATVCEGRSCSFWKKGHKSFEKHKKKKYKTLINTNKIR